MNEIGSWVISLTVGPIETNCYILLPRTGRDATIIDPGFEGERITGILRNRDMKLERILLTHGHIDHLFALNDVLMYMRSSEAGVLIHHEDETLIDDLVEQADFLGVEVPPLPPDAFSTFKDGEILHCSGHSLTVLHTPGHSPGSCSFLFEDAQLLFSGDTLFCNGVGRTDLWGGSDNELSRSIEEKILSLGDHIMILPGHGPPTTVREARDYWAS